MIRRRRRRTIQSKSPGAPPKDDPPRENWHDDETVYIQHLAHADVIRELEDEDNTLLRKMANRTYFTVVVYDIVDNKRRARVAKSLLGYGERVQYSGFEAHLTSKQLVTLTSKIKEMIDEKEDRVRIYKIAGQPQVTVFGSIPLYEDEEFTII